MTASYLLYGLAVIVCMGMAGAFSFQSILSSRLEQDCLRDMRRIASSVPVEGEDAAQVQTFVENVRREGSFRYCGVVSAEGRYIAHTTAALVGQEPTERPGTSETLGGVTRVRFSEADKGTVREYRSTLKRNARVVGSIRFAVAEPAFWTTVRSVASHATWMALGPMLLVGLGSMALGKAVKPLGYVDGQLRQAATAPSLTGLQLQRVPSHGPATVGWNRLVDERVENQKQSTLETNLGEALRGFREKKLDVILNSLADGILVADGDGKITFGNHAVMALLDGNEEEKMEGSAVEECLRRRWPVADDSPLLDPKSQARPVTDELSQGEEGTRRVLRIARYPMRGESGPTVTGYVWSMRDITQQKMVEEARNQFVDTATHELRTPLANIKAYAETLALNDIPDVEQQKEFLNTINSEATRLARFVDDLLSVSSMEVGSMALSKTQTDLARLLDEVITKARPQMDKKELSFETSLPAKLPSVQWDKDKMAATLVNMLGNAAKYTPEGGRVALRIRHVDDQIEIDVEDSGVGISEKELPNVFNKFFRSQDPRVQAETGTGLGLSLTQEVIRLHGGKLSVESELNKGTKFMAIVPVP